MESRPSGDVAVEWRLVVSYRSTLTVIQIDSKTVVYEK